MINLVTKGGQRLVLPESAPCFSFLKTDQLFEEQAGRFGTSAISIHSVEYEPSVTKYTKQYIDIAKQYFTELFDTDVLNAYAACCRYSDMSVALPVSHVSGTEMVAIFSLVRYIEKYPTVVLDAMHMNNLIDFDKALYLAHFLELTADIGLYAHNPDMLEWSQYMNPLNHSVVPNVLRVGGHKFLTDGLARAHLLPVYRNTYSYANIQGIVGGGTGQPLPYSSIMDDDEIIKLADQL